MKTLLYYLELVRDRPKVAYIFRYMIADAVEDVMLGAECAAACFEFSSIDAYIETFRLFQNLKLERARK